MNDLQRTDEWYLARRGKVTASECYLLLGNGKRQMTDEELFAWRQEHPKSRATTVEVPFSQGTYTYLDEKVAEAYMPDREFLMYVTECKAETRAMQWGTTFESQAREAYCEATGSTVTDAPFLPLDDFPDYAGGSPDGLLEDCGIIEIKCPYNPAVHMRHFLYSCPEDLLEDNPQYYHQCQYNMLVTGAEFCDFVSYDPRTSRSKQLKILRVPFDHEVQGLLLERTGLAAEYMRLRMRRINNSEQVIL